MPGWRPRTPSHRGRSRASTVEIRIRPRSDGDPDDRVAVYPRSNRFSAAEARLSPRLDPAPGHSKCILPSIRASLDTPDRRPPAGGCGSGAPARGTTAVQERLESPSGGSNRGESRFASPSAASDRGASGFEFPSTASDRGARAIRVTERGTRPRCESDSSRRARHPTAVRCRAGWPGGRAFLVVCGTPDRAGARRPAACAARGRCLIWAVRHTP